MAVSIAQRFSEEEKKKIVDAVQRAEGRTSGEIVPYIVEQCDEYAVAEWRAGATLGAAATIGFWVAAEISHGWLPLEFTVVLMVILFAFLVGMTLARFSRSVRRIFVGRRAMEHHVTSRAAQAFISEEVFKTADRTGILLFVSVFEHRAIVLGDSGINAHVAQAEWDEVIARIVKGVQRNALIDGLVDAIDMCGTLLERRGLPRKADDRDELSDSLRASDR